MARPKAFDPTEALDKAVDLFWQKGFEATSIQDLVDQMEIQRGSLYDTFGGKNELFASAIDRYFSKTCEQIACFDCEDAGVKTIRCFFEGVAEKLATEEGRKGCFLTNTAVEANVHDAPVLKILEEAMSRIEKGFFLALSKAKERGELLEGQDPKSLSRYLACLLQGLSVRAKTGPGKKVLQEIVKQGLSIFE